MKTLLLWLLFIVPLSELHAENHTVILVNSSGEQAIVHLAADFGSQFGNYLAVPGIEVMKGDSCNLTSNYRGGFVLLYVEFPMSGTDIQNSDDDRDKYKLTLAKKRMKSNPENYTGPSAKYFIRYDIDPNEDTLLIEIKEVSDCLGVCRNGKGIKKGFKNVYNGMFDNQGKPHGEGQFTINDTIWDGTWNDALPNGFFTISSDGYLEKGKYINGVRDGKFTFEIGDHILIHQFYVNGELHGPFREQIRTLDGIQVTKGTYEHGKPKYDPNSKTLNKPRR